MDSKTSQTDSQELESKKGTSAILPVVGVIVGAAVMAVVTNHKNQQRAQIVLEKVKKKASSYMQTAKERVQEGQKKAEKTLDVVKDSDKKVAGIWNK